MPFDAYKPGLFNLDYDPEGDLPTFRSAPEFADLHLDGVPGSEELFALNEANITAQREEGRRAQLLDAWLIERGLVPAYRERLMRAQFTARQQSMEAIEDVMQRGAWQEGETFVLRQDPLFLMGYLQSVVSELDGVAQKLRQTASVVADYVPAVQAAAQTALVAVLTVREHAITARHQVTQRAFERVEHGIPEWDIATASERPLDVDLPTWSGAAGSALPTQETSQETSPAQDTIIAQRLLSGWLDA